MPFTHFYIYIFENLWCYTLQDSQLLVFFVGVVVCSRNFRLRLILVYFLSN